MSSNEGEDVRPLGRRSVSLSSQHTPQQPVTRDGGHEAQVRSQCFTLFYFVPASIEAVHGGHALESSTNTKSHTDLIFKKRIIGVHVGKTQQHLNYVSMAIL